MRNFNNLVCDDVRLISLKQLFIFGYKNHLKKQFIPLNIFLLQ